jgi:hypothetical protein
VERSSLTESLQKHPKAVPFRKKSFPLYAEIAELCEDMATGMNTFRPGSSSQSRGTTPQSSEDLSHIDPELVRESRMDGLSRSVSKSRDEDLEKETKKHKHESSESVCATSSIWP